MPTKVICKVHGWCGGPDASACPFCRITTLEKELEEAWVMNGGLAMCRDMIVEGRDQLLAHVEELEEIVEVLLGEDCESFCGFAHDVEHVCWPGKARAALNPKNKEGGS